MLCRRCRVGFSIADAFAAEVALDPSLADAFAAVAAGCSSRLIWGGRFVPPWSCLLCRQPLCRFPLFLQAQFVCFGVEAGGPLPLPFLRVMVCF